MLLAYRPFIDPVAIHNLWYLLLVPMALGIAVAYKAVRVDHFEQYWKQVAVMTVQIIVGMIALGAAFYLLVQEVLPRIVP